MASQYTNDPDIGPMDRVKCECGSEILFKNMTQHVKTKKHMTAMDKLKNPSKEKVEEKVVAKEKPAKTVNEELEEEEECDDVDCILDAIQALHDRLDDIQSLLEVLVQGDDTISEENEEDCDDDEKVLGPSQSLGSVEKKEVKSEVKEVNGKDEKKN